MICVKNYVVRIILKVTLLKRLLLPQRLSALPALLPTVSVFFSGIIICGQSWDHP
jgi:hypothetical protein